MVSMVVINGIWGERKKWVRVAEGERRESQMFFFNVANADVRPTATSASWAGLCSYFLLPRLTLNYCALTPDIKLIVILAKNTKGRETS